MVSIFRPHVGDKSAARLALTPLSNRLEWQRTIFLLRESANTIDDVFEHASDNLGESGYVYDAHKHLDMLISIVVLRLILSICKNCDNINNVCF